MAKQFDPRKVLRQLSNAMLRDFFTKRQELMDVRWDDLSEKDVQPIYEAWQNLGSESRREVQIILQDVNELADERGLALLAEEIAWRCPDCMTKFMAITGHGDKAMWVYMNTPQAFKEASMFAQALALSTGRYWEKRDGLPKKAIDVTDDLKEQLAASLAAHYGPAEGRGQWCHVEHYRRANGAEYFFAYLDDYPDNRLVWNDAGEMHKQPERAAFDNVFVYCPDDGTLEVFARGGRKAHDPLQKVFCKAILGVDLEPAPPNRPAYALNVLNDPSFQFPTDPRDHIAEVRIRAMRVEPISAPRRSILLRADPKGHKNDIHQMMASYLNSQALSRNKVRVTLTTLQISLISDGQGKPKTMTFDLSYPSSCNLKSKPDEMRAIGERCLKKWGIVHA